MKYDPKVKYGVDGSQHNQFNIWIKSDEVDHYLAET